MSLECLGVNVKETDEITSKKLKKLKKAFLALWLTRGTGFPARSATPLVEARVISDPNPSPHKRWPVRNGKQ